MFSYYLVNRNFMKMWASNLSSILGGRFKELAIPLIVLSLTKSPFITGLVALSQQLGSILLAVPMGTWIEGKNKRTIAVFSKLFSFIIVFFLSLLLFSNQINSLLIASLLFLAGVSGLASRTAFNAMIPSVSGRDKLVNAHTSLEAADAIATLIGPLIGGILIARYGASMTMAICSLFILLSMIWMWRVKFTEDVGASPSKENQDREKMRSFAEKSKEGFKYLVDNEFQFISTVTICVLSFSTSFVVLTVIIHGKNTLNLDPDSIGFLLACAGIGNIAGVLLLKWMNQLSWIPTLAVLLAISGAGTLLLSISYNYWLSCFGMILFDGALSMAFVVQASVHQGITPDGALSRVRSSTYVLGGIFAMLGSFLSGAIPAFATTNAALVVGALVLMIPAIYIYSLKKRSVPMNQVEPISLKW
ncbi:MFS transporter [Pontibacillus salipaludis]|uniref:MFS transporter n=1 Tax=Pontibacillus salipaludis TaxID=1697394 RepID=UPI0031E919AE